MDTPNHITPRKDGVPEELQRGSTSAGAVPPEHPTVTEPTPSGKSVGAEGEGVGFNGLGIGF